MLMQGSDEQLVPAVQAGDPDAATELVDRHYAAIYAFLRRLSGTDAEAADLTQRTFSRVWTAIARFGGRSTLKSWLHGIARHVWLDWLRQNHREVAVAETWWNDLADSAPAPDETASRSDLSTTLYAAVDDLPEELRTTVHLHYYQGLTLQDTADSLEIATSTVKHRLRTAIGHLRTALADPTPSATVLR
ncbi:MAG: RNA polymerase sigma factor [Verrucomicrobiales bacterium]|nr:RNA polymerase sigma factor [Verrucomicrobiales bacterium]